MKGAALDIPDLVLRKAMARGAENELAADFLSVADAWAKGGPP